MDVYGDTELLNIALGKQQSVRSSPIVATVLTEDDILGVPARTLDDILFQAVGIHQAVDSLYNQIYSIRGLSSPFSQTLLFLNNGTDEPAAFFGPRLSPVSQRTLMRRLKRIEIQRSPGSAIYGADAFSGVINLITKPPLELQQTRLGGQIGSFDSQFGWLIHGEEFGGFKTYFAAYSADSDGDDLLIDSDAQTRHDSLLNTTASLAPGDARAWRRASALVFAAKGNGFNISANYEKFHAGWGAGFRESLQPKDNRGESTELGLIGKYEQSLTPNTKALYTLRLNQNEINPNEAKLSPPGALGGAATIGIIDTLRFKEKYLAVDAKFLYSGFDHATIDYGFGYNILKVRDASIERNYLDFNGNILPFDFTSTVNIDGLIANERENSYVFFQHNWNFLPDWTLTTGGRLNHFNTYGSKVSPRMGLVWFPTLDSTWKILYGRAFQPPALVEGGDLLVSRIDTYEIANIYRLNKNLSTALTAFSYDMKNPIEDVDTDDPLNRKLSQNYEGQTGYGVEAELKWRVNDNWRVVVNHTQLDAERKDTGQYPGYAPKHTTYLRLNWRAKPQWLTGLEFKNVGNRRRGPADSRPPLDGYTTTNVVIRRFFNPEFSISLLGRNIFDVDARDPSPAPGLNIPNDFPLEGRSLYIEAEYVWDKS